MGKKKPALTSKLGLFLKSVRIRKNLSVDRVQLRLGSEGLTVADFEFRPEALPTDELLRYFVAIEMTGDEYSDFCEISILEFGRRASQPRLKLAVTANTKSGEKTHGQQLKKSGNRKRSSKSR